MFIRLMRALLVLCTLTFVATRGGEPADKNAARAADAAEFVKQGRQLFGQAQYGEALRAFEKALDKAPANKETRFLAALAAYWARKPERALEYWNQLRDLATRDAATRGGNDEWEVEKNRVLALTAMGKFDAAELAVMRLREIRADGKSSAAKTARGFVREHFFGKNMRAGFWEAFDERGDAPALWSVTVTQSVEAPPTPVIAGDAAATEKAAPAKRPLVDKNVAAIAVEPEVLPGGGAGYVLSEEAGDMRRIYKRWVRRPEYAEVRALALDVLHGTAAPLEEKQLPPAPADPTEVNGTHIVPHEIHSMGLDVQTETMVYIAWKLRLVKANVTDLARLEDPAAIDDYVREFNAANPRAAGDASELTELIKEAKAENVGKACEIIMKLTFRSAYLEFALLTALNTRNRDIPEEPLRAFLKSPDFMVRETSALLLARHGKKDGVEILFKELESADARGCVLLMAALDELLGHVLDSPPNPHAAEVGEKLKAWKSTAADWRAANFEKLIFDRNSKPGEASWSVK